MKKILLLVASTLYFSLTSYATAPLIYDQKPGIDFTANNFDFESNEHCSAYKEIGTNDDASVTFTYIAPGVSDDTQATGAKGPQSYYAAGWFELSTLPSGIYFSVKNSNESKFCLKYGFSDQTTRGLIADGGDCIMRIDDMKQDEVIAIRCCRKSDDKAFDFLNTKRQSAVLFIGTDVKPVDVAFDKSGDPYFVSNIDECVNNVASVSSSDTVVCFYKVNENISVNSHVDFYITNAALAQVYFFAADSEVSKNFDNLVVGVEEKNAGEVVGQYYLNASGVKSKHSFAGFNVNVSVLDNGEVKAAKEVRKQ